MNDDLTILFKVLRSFAATKPVRSRVWLRFIKSKPCILCGAPADDPHHIFGSYMSHKTSDLFTVPVCRADHDKVEKPEFRLTVMSKWMMLVHEYLRDQFSTE